MPEFDRAALLKKWVPDIADRIEFVPAATHETLARIGCGVFFVMAFWSSPAIQVFAELARTLHRIDPQGRLCVVVGDTDEIVELHDRPPFVDNTSGTGVTLWISKGRVIARSGRGADFDCIKPNTIQLLALCAKE